MKIAKEMVRIVKDANKEPHDKYLIPQKALNHAVYVTLVNDADGAYSVPDLEDATYVTAGENETDRGLAHFGIHRVALSSDTSWQPLWTIDSPEEFLANYDAYIKTVNDYLATIEAPTGEEIWTTEESKSYHDAVDASGDDGAFDYAGGYVIDGLIAMKLLLQAVKDSMYAE